MKDNDRFRLAIVPVDQAMWESEQKYGVGRLERLVSPATLASYRRGWDLYRAALEASDAAAVEAVGPRMVAALAVMDAEARKNGFGPLAPDTWETPLGDDGTVLVVVRTQAEQAAVIRANNPTRITAAPEGGLRGETPTSETCLPPDLSVTVRGQHEGRAIEVWTLGEIARLILVHGSVAREPKKWEGTPAVSGAQGCEGDAADIARSGYPLSAALVLPF
jgi:hypothetical protein